MKKIQMVVWCAFVGCGSMGGELHGAKLTQLEGDPLGLFLANGSGELVARGPRYDNYGNLLTGSVSNSGAYLPYANYSGDSDSLFVSAAAVVDDPVYYPYLSNIALTWGSISASIYLDTVVPNDGSGGGDEESGRTANLFTNSVVMTMSSGLFLEAHPVTWKNNISSPAGQEDNESFNTTASFSAATNSDNGFIYFRIDPVFNEQAGDAISVKLDHSREFSAVSHYGNDGYNGSLQVSNDFTLNGNLLSNNGGDITAAIGDVIGIKLSMELLFSGGGQIVQPEFSLNKYMLVAAVLGDTRVSIDIPLTLGCTQQAPLMPIRIDDNSGAFVFDDLTIGSEGVGIDTPAWIDPDIAIGYDLVVVGAGVTAVVLPDILRGSAACQLWYDDGAGPLQLSYYDEFDETFYFDFYAGGEILFPHAVNVFGITGIDPLLELDPANPNAFPLGLIFEGEATNVSITMTPVSVPEPATWGLLLLGGLLFTRRRREL